jgi:hypothetical protein
VHTETRPQEPLQMCMLQRRPSSAATALHARLRKKRTNELGAKTAAKDMDGGEEFGNPQLKKVPRIKKMNAGGGRKT